MEQKQSPRAYKKITVFMNMNLKWPETEEPFFNHF